MNFGTILNRALNSKYWKNISQYCNRKTHVYPHNLEYRPYRRGKSRCSVCGAKIGKIKCEYKSNKEYLVDNIFTENSLLKILKDKNRIQENVI